MDIQQSNKRNVIAYSAIIGALALWLIYTNLTGWYLFNSEDKKQAWSASGPGYHK